LKLEKDLHNKFFVTSDKYSKTSPRYFTHQSKVACASS